MSASSDIAGSLDVRRVPPTVHVVERLAPGGIETLVLDLARASSKPHALVSLQGNFASLAADWPLLRSVPFPIEGFDRRGVDPGLIVRVARHLAAMRPAAVFVHHMGPLLYGGLAARLAGVRRLVHVEHDAWHYENLAEARLGRWCARVLRPHVVAVSEQVAERTRAVMPGRPVSVVAPGVSTERFKPADKAAARQRLSIDAKWRVVGAAGRLVPVKGYDVLLNAIRQMDDDVHVVIVGDGPERANLQTLVEGLRLVDRVHMLGHRDDLPDLYPAFDVFCQPSLHEGLPRSVLEAQACGVPVVATRTGGMPEAVCPMSGFIVQRNDPKDLAAALSRSLARTGTTSPRRFVEEKLSLAHTIRSYAKLVEA